MTAVREGAREGEVPVSHGPSHPFSPSRQGQRPRSSQLAGYVEDETEPVPDLAHHCTTDVPGHLVALLIAAGEDPYVISQRLGHASIRTTYDIYGHLFEGQDRQAADASKPPGLDLLRTLRGLWADPKAPPWASETAKSPARTGDFVVWS